MGGPMSVLCAFLCVYLFAHLPCGARSIPEKDMPLDSGDVIMREDAEEVFYNVNIEKYDDLGIRCPEPEPPENGAIKGEGTRVGSVVYVVCKEGFVLHGPTVMACVPFGEGAQWDPSVSRQCVEGRHEFEETNEVSAEDSESEEIPPEPESLEEVRGRETEEEDGVGEEEDARPPPYLSPRLHKSRLAFKQHNNLPEHVPEEERADLESNMLSEELSQTPRGCFLTPDPGPCRALFRRYFFDKTTMECHPFIYGGCQGNENRFATMEECNSECLRGE
ncbi:amyloid-beta A4 protein [Aplysia californica]|uniref:Amyloid-beta A4 protein n=1 Tax=Aplysia californica TaxID=6500 RepID=A0ABM0ZZ32_APLCA|nr:amyloid-beta A4 protein [Aplysia californica]